MSDVLTTALAILAGSALGAMFYGGLWWAIRRALTSEQPALWFVVSLVVRTTLTLGGFYLVGGTRWERWVACLVGFVAARMIVTRYTGALDAAAPAEARHAP